MKTIREELEVLGPKRVRRGMVAFEHQSGQASCERAGPCCFLAHIGDGETLTGHRSRLLELRKMLGGSWVKAPLVEAAFEGWASVTDSAREELRQECIAFLAEHGSAQEAKVVWRAEPALAQQAVVA